MADGNDAIEAALDRAIDSIETEKEPEAASYSREVESVEEEATNKALVEKRAAPVKERDESGKFKGKKPYPQKGKAEPEPVEAAPEETNLNDHEANDESQEAPVTEESDLAPIEAPAFWSAEEKALLAKAPRDLQQLISQKEAQRTEWGNRLQAESQRGKAFEKRMYEDMENDPQRVSLHKAQLRKAGLRDEVDELHRYRAWDLTFKSDVKSGIADLMRKNGLTPYDFTQDEQETYQPLDPRIEEIQAEAREAKELAAKYQQEVEAERERQLFYEIETFKNGTDSQGAVRRPFVEAYAPQIDRAIAIIHKEFPQLTRDQALNHAYEYCKAEAAKALNATGFKSAAPKNQAQVIADAKKAKAAASSVTGAPSSGVAPARPKEKGIDAAIERALERQAQARA